MTVGLVDLASTKETLTPPMTSLEEATRSITKGEGLLKDMLRGTVASSQQSQQNHSSHATHCDTRV